MSTHRPVLLLLPGLLCDQAAWAEAAALLASRADCRIPSWGMLDSIEAMAAHVLATVPEPRFSLAGHSMGGRIALEIVRQAPHRVERLALLDTGYQPLAAADAGERERAGRYALLEQAREQGMRAMGAVWAVGMVAPERVGTPLFEAILDMIERSSPAQFEAQIRALLGRPDASGVLPDIGCPTLLLCGREDRWSPLARHEDMLAQIPGAVLEVVEEAGHMTTMESPHAVARALSRWLDQDAATTDAGREPLSALDIVIAKQACHDLIVRFAAFNDGRDAAALARLFAEDGVMRRPDGSELRGRTAIAAAYAERSADRLTRHHVGNVLIDVESPVSASGTSSVLLWSASASDPVGPFGRPAAARQVMGEFHDRFVKTADGWRIAERVARFTLLRESGA